MLEFLGTILMIGYLVFMGVYLYTAINEHERSNRLIFKPVIVVLVVIISFLLLGIILRGCGLDLFESNTGYQYRGGGPY